MASSALNRSRSVSFHHRQLLRHRARRMRHEPTQTEWLLWQALRRKQLGVRFRRQVVLQGYIADFYAALVRLIIEVDGAYHAQRSRSDARRDRRLGSVGYHVLRVTSEEVLADLAGVVARIQALVGC